MSEARYRLRRPVLLWALIGPLAAGGLASIVFGVLFFLLLNSAELVASGFTGLSMFRALPGVAYLAAMLSLPGAFMVVLVSIAIFWKTGRRTASSRWAVIAPNEKYIWIGIWLLPLIYPLAFRVYFWSWSSNIIAELFYSLALFPVYVIVAFMARPLYFRIVTARIDERPPKQSRSGRRAA